MTVAVLPASFDPITCGHVDLATRACRLFDRLIVAVYACPKKTPMFSLDERLVMVHESLEGLDRLDIRSFEGLVVDFCREVHADVLVRGLRTVSDFESEFQQATLNRQMLPGLEVIGLFASPQYTVLSSSMIKEIAESGGDVSMMVPAPVVRRLTERLRQSSPFLASGG